MRTPLCILLLASGLLGADVAAAGPDENPKKPDTKPGTKPDAKPKKPLTPAAKSRLRVRRAQQRMNKALRHLRGWLPPGLNPYAMREALALDGERVLKLSQLVYGTHKLVTALYGKWKKQGVPPDKRVLQKMRHKVRHDLYQKVRLILTHEQHRQWRKRVAQAMRRGKLGGGQANPQRVRQRVTKILKLSEEEVAVIGPLLDTLVRTQQLLQGQRAQRRKKYVQAIAKTNDEEQHKALLKQFRKENAEDQATLKKARAQLAESLTPSQEAKLVGLGLLE